MKESVYHLLDVFTNQRFGGNQLAIFEDATEIPTELFQNIARELNLSETVFLYPKNDQGHYPMRIFTPVKELPTAGHPTIGTAYFLAQKYPQQIGQLELIMSQKIGEITVKVDISSSGVTMATMYQIDPIFGKVFDNRHQIADLLSLKESDLLAYPIQEVSCGVPYIIIPVKTIKNIENIIFRTDIWEQLKPLFNENSVYVFTPHGTLPNGDLHGRMFAPELGVNEDPATGSANGPLVCYLLKHNIKKGPLISEQGFEMGRPSILHIHIENEGDKITAVKIGGQAIIVGRGTFFL